METNEIIQVNRMTCITELKHKFPCNNPCSWGKLSKKQLSSMYSEYILNDTSIKVKIS